jgi:hypothetical protein
MSEKKQRWDSPNLLENFYTNFSTAFNCWKTFIIGTKFLWDSNIRKVTSWFITSMQCTLKLFIAHLNGCYNASAPDFVYVTRYESCQGTGWQDSYIHAYIHWYKLFMYQWSILVCQEQIILLPRTSRIARCFFSKPKFKSG